MIQVKTFFAHNELRNFSYLLYDDEAGKSWAIDPYEANPMIEFIKKNALSLEMILNTHQHFDHIRGNAPLKDVFNSPVKKLRDSEKISLSSEFHLVTLDTPGHTLDHQVFVLENEVKAIGLFSGDTLFNAGVGNCKNGGDVSKLYITTKNLIQSLPPDTLLYPGHDYIKNNLNFAYGLEPSNQNIRDLLQKIKEEPTEDAPPLTLGQEMSVNPFLRLDSKELQQLVKAEKNSIEDEGAIERKLFYKIRSLRDLW